MPRDAVHPNSMGSPRFTSQIPPLRPRVLSIILKPLLGKSPHHINSTQDFVEQANKVTLLPGECLSSYDVTSLFISVPIDPALGTIKDLLKKGNALKEKTVLSVKDIIPFLEFCLKNNFFSLQGQFYELLESVAMGCPVSPIVASLYMEYFEQKALSTATHPSTPRKWFRYVGETFSSKRKITNKTYLNTFTMLTHP